MIAFFPELYEDELAYSWFSRYYTKSGYLSLRYALDDLYVKRYVNPDTEFVNELRPEVKELVIKHCGMENLILGHTMFSSYGRFLPDAKKQEASSLPPLPVSLFCGLHHFFHHICSPAGQISCPCSSCPGYRLSMCGQRTRDREQRARQSLA